MDDELLPSEASLFGSAGPMQSPLLAAATAATQRMLDRAINGFPPGTELWTTRSGGYHHAGVYVGQGRVVHVDRDPISFIRDAVQGKPIVPVVCTDMMAFSGGRDVIAGPTRPAFPGAVIVHRAMAAVGQLIDYNPVSSNCQHFSSFIVSGQRTSPEIARFEQLVRDGVNRVRNGVTGLGP